MEGIPPGPGDQTCYEIGVGLGKLHTLNIGKDELAPIRSYENVGFSPQQIEEYIKSESCPIDFKNLFLSLFPDFAKNCINFINIFCASIVLFLNNFHPLIQVSKIMA